MNEKDLHKYQEVAVTHIIDKTHSALFLDMGLGKTVSTLTAIKKLMYEELDISKTLVVAPKRVAESVWTNECQKWEHLRGLKCVKIIGSEKERRLALREQADIYLIGRDNIAWLCGQYGGEMLPFDMLVIDELSSFKNHKSVRFKALRKVQPSFKRVVGLTGTPAPNGLTDLWSQIFLLDRGVRLGMFIGQYRNNYFKADKRNGHIVFKYKATPEGEKEIHRKIGDICLSMKASDYLELPGRIENIIELIPTEDVKRQYEDFERKQVLQLFESDNEITAINAAALTNKLSQFANGAVYDEDKNTHIIHGIKLEALLDIIEDANGKPVLVAWAFKHDEKRIHEYLKSYKPRALKVDKDVTDWNNGDVQIMTMHPASGGHGLNLQAGGHIIVWFGQNWSLELEQQFNARLDRQGQTNRVIINKLVLKGTVDEDIIKSLKQKNSTQEGLMEAVKARIEKYIKKSK